MLPDAEQIRSRDLADAGTAARPTGLGPTPTAAGAVAEALTETVVDAETATGPGTSDADLSPRHGAHRDHHVLREAQQDRWRWRAKIRQSPHQLRVYRFAVGVLGALLVVLGCVSGPLPGPGGIPLVLLGLAVWASEFVWAQHLMGWFKAQLHRFRSWTRPQQTLAWVVFFAVCGLFGYSYLLVLGPPGWLPGGVGTMLARLPGL